MNNNFHSTICWHCEKASGRCSWSRSFTPVEGWEAIPTKHEEKLAGGCVREVRSYDVYSCPEFELLVTIKHDKKEMEKWLRLLKEQRTLLPNDTNT